jgi:hypothetical protein
MAKKKITRKKSTNKKAKVVRKKTTKPKTPYVWKGDPRLPSTISRADNQLTKNNFAKEEFAYPPPCNDSYDVVSERTIKGNGKQWPREYRRRWLLEKAEEVGLLSIHKTETAKMMGVSRQYLYEDIKFLYKLGIPEDYIQYAKVDMARAFDQNLKKAQQLTQHKNSRTSLNAIMVANSTMKDKIEFMEKFGIKKPVEANVSQQIIVSWKPLPKEKQVEKKTEVENLGSPQPDKEPPSETKG